MTGRRSPVGVVVFVLASLIAVGCTAQTSAVFESLLDPPLAPASPSEGGGSSDAATAASSPTTWWHPDGYTLSVPGGWSIMAVGRAQEDQFLDAVEGSHPGVAERMSGVLAGTRARVSAIAADMSLDADLSPVMIILAQPTNGERVRAVKTRVRQQISDLPGRSGTVLKNDVHFPAASGAQFDYSLEDADLGQLRVRSYLFRYLSQAYLVSFVASADEFEAAESVFAAMAMSLRFGV